MNTLRSNGTTLVLLLGLSSMLAACHAVDSGVESFGAAYRDSNEVGWWGPTYDSVTGSYTFPIDDKNETEVIEGLFNALDELGFTVDRRDEDYIYATSADGVPIRVAQPVWHSVAGVGSWRFAILPPDDVTYGTVPDEHLETALDLHIALRYLVYGDVLSRDAYRGRVAGLNARLNAARAGSVGAASYHGASPRMPQTPKMPY